MDNDRFDLTPLDPAREPRHWKRLIRRIVDAAAPELARRGRLSRSVLATIGGWTRPALTAAALSGVAAVGLWNRPPSDAPSAGSPASARAEGGPAQAPEVATASEPGDRLPEWALAGHVPSAAELLAVVEGGAR